MRTSATLLATLASIVGVGTSVRAQRVDSVMDGSWAGRAPIAVPWTQHREVTDEPEYANARLAQ